MLNSCHVAPQGGLHLSGDPVVDEFDSIVLNSYFLQWEFYLNENRGARISVPNSAVSPYLIKL